MKTVKMTLGLVVAMCVLAAVAGAASAAPVFRANQVGKTPSEEAPLKTRGRNLDEQKFKFGVFSITCQKARLKGAVTAEETKHIYAEVRYTECSTYLKAGRESVGPFPVHFKTPIDFEYHANGYAETGAESESEIKILNPGEVSAKISGTGCVIYWPPQTIPVRAIKHPEEEFSAVQYSNEEVANPRIKQFPSGFQKKLIIANELKKIESHVEEGKCEEFEHPETKTGSYTGTLTDEIPLGNLEISSNEEA